MAVLLILPAWLLIVTLVLALCAAARRGEPQADDPMPTVRLAAADRELLDPPVEIHVLRREQQAHLPALPERAAAAR